ncbi:fructose bisphosphate aldolase [Actinomycetaceae bacterium MB13-C1-2]|nr:fructose bisphosphate aldolase [Actinomycetaceae bacterium MB13-C1-2]
MTDNQRLSRFETGSGFIAALDQSGGSTPRALRQYGIDESQYSNDDEMFGLIHEARTRIITSPVFTSDRILGAILFQGTLERDIGGRSVVDYLWNEKGILPFLKIDRGLEDEEGGVQMMKPISGLEETLARAAKQGVFGTKERSVIHSANPEGIRRIVEQQFEVANKVLDAGLVPIVEPEVDIRSVDRAESDVLLKKELLEALDKLGDRKVALKLSPPVEDGFYADLISHPNVARVVALSGGYSREEANEILARNPALIASFSRALLEGLTAQQDDEEFNRTLDTSIESIYDASMKDS